MKIFKHFLLGLVTGWMSIILLAVIWIFFSLHCAFENDLKSQVILLNNNGKLLFTFDTYGVNISEPDTPILTYLKNDNTWVSKNIPEGTIGKDDEYILTTSLDKSLIYLLLPQKNNGYLWDLNNDSLQTVSDINALEIGKKYIHERP